MASTAADILIESLQDWGVRRFLVFPATGLTALWKRFGGARTKSALFRRATKKPPPLWPAAMLNTLASWVSAWPHRGPGGIHLLNGLYDAKLDGQPVLAITGHHYHDLIDTHAQQDVNLDRLFADVSVYNTRVMGPAHVENVVDLACRTALGYRGVAHINFPVDLQDQEVSERSKRNIANHTSDVLARRARLPAEDDIVKAAAVLNAGKKIAILCGQGALDATDELEASCRKIRRADRQGIARKSGGSRYEPVHDGRNRAARYQAVARSPRRIATPF